MLEVNLVADLLIAMKEGIRPKSSFVNTTTSYEREYDEDISEVRQDLT